MVLRRGDLNFCKCDICYRLNWPIASATKAGAEKARAAAEESRKVAEKKEKKPTEACTKPKKAIKCDNCSAKAKDSNEPLLAANGQSKHM